MNLNQHFLFLFNYLLSFVSLGHLAFKLSGFLRFNWTGFPWANAIKALKAQPPMIKIKVIKNK